MSYKQLCDQARQRMGEYCHACYVCNGVACRGAVPGPGGIGSGQVPIKNFEGWQDIEIVMDTIGDTSDPDTSCTLFGQSFDLPVFVAPVGDIQRHYSDYLDTISYSRAVLRGARREGSCAFVGDGLDERILQQETELIFAQQGMGIPTIKPWDMETIFNKIEMVKRVHPVAIAMDIDAAGLPFLQGQTPPAGPKTVAQLKEIVQACGDIPFLLKGIMSEEGAYKAKEAKCYGIVVSNHGGRVLDGCPSTASVLPKIKQAAGDDMKVLVDGGIRSGLDVYRALQLGVDAALIARPFVVAAFANKYEGVAEYMAQIKAELKQTMLMCGKKDIDSI